jgi:hypothetical protein
MTAHAIAVIARSFRSLWFDSLATLKPQAGGAPRPQTPSASQNALQRGSNRTTAADNEAAGPHYSFRYTNGTQTTQDTRGLEFSTDRAARREASRTAREMANDASWESSARGAGWTVLVLNPSGQQICEVPVRFKKRWF